MQFFHFFYSYNHDSISLMKMQISKIQIFTFILIVFFTSGGINSLRAESRTGNLDFFMLIDRSLSMVEEFSAVQDYVEGQVIQDLLQTGDYITVIAFYGDRQHVVSGIIGTDLTKAKTSELIDSLAPDRHYTDIGSALDELNQTMEEVSRTGYPDYALLLTDGIHEGPPNSPYSGKTKSFEHPMLRRVKRISRNNWRVEILAFTVREEAGRLASDVIAAWQNRN